MPKLKPVVIDFETKPIAAWPDYPPKPVGVSIRLPKDRKAKYYAWGHPTENNCSYEDALQVMKAIWASGEPILCHNAKFDLDVAETHMGLALPSWERIHDTMFLIFLNDPHSPNLKLKPAAERLLGLPPEEQDAVRDWCIAEKLIPRNAKEFGHLICQAPGALVGKYANGDVDRTLKLFEKLYPAIVARGMLGAYERERKLLPILLRNEHQGVQVDLAKMREDDAKYEKAQQAIDSWLKDQLCVPPEFNLDSDDQLADALVATGKADPSLFDLTPTGKRSTAKDSLIGAVTDKAVLGGLRYRASLATAYGTFLHPWYLEAEACGGIVHPSWNQVRQAGYGKDTAGARTGRLSASRFMNVPKEFKAEHPDYIPGLPTLPFMRLYMQAFKGEAWGKRDYMQQELRVLGHFGDGVLMQRFQEDPSLDVHVLAADLITQQFGVPVTRRETKTLGFGLLYGMGLGSLAQRLGTDLDVAKTIKKAYLGIFPELAELQQTLKHYAKSGQPLRTWGGREYYVEEPKVVGNRLRTFEYKLLNYLIQGSSADCTKEAIIRYDSVKKDGRFVLTVHDEINISAPKKAIQSEMKILYEAMKSVEFDVPMLSDGGIGPNWGALKEAA